MNGARSESRGNWIAIAWGLLAGAATIFVAVDLADRLTPLLDKRRALFVLPILLAAPFYPAWIGRVRRGELRAAVLASLAWAFATSVASIVWFRRTGDDAAGLVWNSIAYRQDMLTWLSSGIGQEGDPSLFVPQHAVHFAAFAVASLLTVGFAGLVLGAALLTYMNFYVAALFLRAHDAGTIAAFGWPAYAIVRVVGYVCVGSALAGVALNVVGKAGVPWRRVVTTLSIGVALVLLDLFLKWQLAPWYRETLSSALR